MIEIWGLVLTVCVAALTAWRWWLSHRQWALTQKDKQRDEALADLIPRVKAIEDAIRTAQVQKAFGTR